MPMPYQPINQRERTPISDREWFAWTIVVVLAFGAVAAFLASVGDHVSARTAYTRGYAAACDSVRRVNWTSGADICRLYEAAGVPYQVVAVPAPGDTVLVWPGRPHA